MKEIFSAIPNEDGDTDPRLVLEPQRQGRTPDVAGSLTDGKAAWPFDGSGGQFKEALPLAREPLSGFLGIRPDGKRGP